MKFNEDWSLAYFLYYLCVISYWTLPILYLTQFVPELLFGNVTDLIQGNRDLFFRITQITGLVLTEIIFIQLSLAMKPVAEGNPFNGQISFRLSVISWSIVAYCFIKAFSFAVLMKTPSLPFSQYGELFIENFELSFFMVSLFIFVLSYVFKEGERIFQEQQLTI